MTASGTAPGSAVPGPESLRVTLLSPLAGQLQVECAYWQVGHKLDYNVE